MFLFFTNVQSSVVLDSAKRPSGPRVTQLTVSLHLYSAKRKMRLRPFLADTAPFKGLRQAIIDWQINDILLNANGKN